MAPRFVLVLAMLICSACKAGQDESCRVAADCAADLDCVHHRCLDKAGAASFCKKSVGCRSGGTCTPIAGGCWVGNGDDCRNSDNCRIHGHCSFNGRAWYAGPGRCIAATPGDCEVSDACTKGGRCFNDAKGQCIRR